MIVNDIRHNNIGKVRRGLKGKKMVIKVKGREGRLNEKKCIEGHKGGVITKQTSLEPGVRILLCISIAYRSVFRNLSSGDLNFFLFPGALKPLKSIDFTGPGGLSPHSPP